MFFLYVEFAGQTCVDPGFPLGGSLTATSFDDQSVVSFSCKDPGYEIQGNSALSCSGSNWNGSVPQCVGKNDCAVLC